MEDNTNIIQRITAFYRDCYIKENKNSILNDIFSSKVQNRFFIPEDDQLLNGDLPYYPISEVRANTLLGKINLANEDIELIYASFYASGLAKSVGGHTMNVCAPLIIHPASVIQDKGYYYLTIDYSKRRLNLEPLKYLAEEVVPYSEQKVERFLDNDVFDFGVMSKLKQFIEEHFKGIDTEQMLMFPTPVKEKALKTSVDNVLNEPKIFFASALGLVKKTKDAFGISGELHKIQESKTHSSALKALFGYDEQIQKEESKGMIPAILNDAQQSAIDQLNHYPLSVVSGPPGTGKSFTIASLAIEQMSKGKSTLIVTQNEQALDVISHKIQAHLGLQNVAIEGGSKKEIGELKKHLSHLLGRSYSKRAISSEELIELQNKTLGHHQMQKEFEQEFLESVDNEINWVEFLRDDERLSRYVTNSFERYAAYMTRRKKSHWEFSDLLQMVTEGTISNKKQYIQEYYYYQLEVTIQKHRKDLRTFLNAIRAISKTKKKSLFKEIDFKPVFYAFPIWLVTTDELSSVFPLVKEMFDTVIIDEASQCDIPSAIPALQRAKKAVIVGDTKQLRPVSFLSKLDEWHFLDRHNIGHGLTFELSCRGKSVLDLALETMNNDGVVFLNEHFRSVPSIIQFSNTHFYNNALSIMSQRPDTACEGLMFKKVEGKRMPSGYNKAEAEYIIEQIVSIVKTEWMVAPNLKHSIGILSPFRKQVDYISTQVRKRLSLQNIEQHRIIIGTAHTFQGAERDIMFISLAADDKTPAGAFNFINREDVFNVAITRAAKQQVVVHSFDKENLNQNHLLYNYFHQSMDVFQQPEVSTEHDQFLDEVASFLKKSEIEYWPMYNYAGIAIDILAKIGNKYIAIDLIGYPGEIQGAFPIERYKMLYRCGIMPIPIAYSKWRYEPNLVLHKIKEISKQNSPHGNELEQIRYFIPANYKYKIV